MINFMMWAVYIIGFIMISFYAVAPDVPTWRLFLVLVWFIGYPILGEWIFHIVKLKYGY